MPLSEQGQIRFLRGSAACVYRTYKLLLYFLSFLGPALLISRCRNFSVSALLLIVLIGYGLAGLTFLCLVVLTKKLLIGPIEVTGRVTINHAGVKNWFVATMLTSMVENGPFRTLTSSPRYYRAMGARMPGSVMIGPGAKILEPWFVEVGENVTIGEEAKILGHRGEGREIVLGKVFIADGAIIGLRSTVLPDVHVGTGAVVAACALVVSGTRIPDGEIWGGVPARKIGIAKPASNSSRKQQLVVEEPV